MPQVSINIASRTYEFACGDGEEQRVRELAGYLDGKIDAELFIDVVYNQENSKISALLHKCADITRDDEYFRNIQIHFSDAPK